MESQNNVNPPRTDYLKCRVTGEEKRLIRRILNRRKITEAKLLRELLEPHLQRQREIDAQAPL